MTTTDSFQSRPDWFATLDECREACRTEVQTNPRYPAFKQTHFTAGDLEQFELYRDKTNGRTERPILDLANNVFARLEAEQDTLIGEHLDWPKYHALTTSCVDNTFRYIFHKLKKGCFVKIKDGQLRVFLPFSNAAFVNEWGARMMHDPTKHRSMLDFLMSITREAGYTASANKVNLDTSTWYANNCLVRTEYPIQETDSDLTNLRDMLLTLCKERAVPDLEFFINKRDFPLLKLDGTEPYDHIWDAPTPLLSHCYEKYAPVLSMVTSDHFADIPVPTWEDWQRVSSEHDGRVFENGRQYKDDFTRPWDERIPTAVWRGASTGAGTTIESNPRLYLSSLPRVVEDGHTLLDAGITKWNLRPRKRAGQKYLTTILPKELPFASVPPLTPEQQARFKYIVHVDGHVSAFRLSYELKSGSVLLLQDSPWRMWFRKFLQPYVHYVPVKEDLSDVLDQIRWCRAHDDECRAIAQNAREFYDTYLGREAVLDFWQVLLDNLKDATGIYIYNHLSPRDALAEKELSFMRQALNEYPRHGTEERVYRPIPQLDRGSYGVLRGVQFALNRAMQDDAIDSVLTVESTPTIYDGKHVSIHRAQGLGSDMFLVKKLKADAKSREFLHDAFVGLHINRLRREIPNFAYTFGVTRDGRLLREHVQGPTLAEWLRTTPFNTSTYVAVIVQLLLALKVAQDRCGFIHYDAFPWNVVMINRPCSASYRIGTKVYRLSCKWTAVLIDFGKSHVVSDDRVHHGETILFDMPGFQDVLTLVFTSMHEVVHAGRINQDALNDVFAILNFFAGSDVRKDPFNTTKEMKDWLRATRKFNNVLQWVDTATAQRDPLDLVDFLMRRFRLDGKLDTSSRLKPPSLIGNEILVYDLITGADPVRSCTALIASIDRMVDESDQHDQRLTQLYTRYVVNDILEDVHQTIRSLYPQMLNAVAPALHRMKSKLETLPLAERCSLALNRYKYPRTPIRTPFDENTFSDFDALFASANALRFYVMPDYLQEKELLEQLLVARELSAEDDAFYRREAASVLSANSFAVLHELADKNTFEYLVHTSTQADIEAFGLGWYAYFLKEM